MPQSNQSELAAILVHNVAMSPPVQDSAVAMWCPPDIASELIRCNSGESEVLLSMLSAMVTVNLNLGFVEVVGGSIGGSIGGRISAGVVSHQSNCGIPFVN